LRLWLFFFHLLFRLVLGLWDIPRLNSDLSCGFINSCRVLKHDLVLAHVGHDAGGDEEGGVGAVKGDHISVPRLNDLSIEVPRHLDLSLLIILLKSALEFQALSLFFDEILQE